MVCDNAGLSGCVPTGVSLYSDSYYCSAGATSGTSLGEACPYDGPGELFSEAHLYDSVHQPILAKEESKSYFVLVIRKIT